MLPLSSLSQASKKQSGITKTKQTNMRFRISKVDNSPEEMEGKHINYDTAKNLVIFQIDTINTIRIGEDKYRFNTGFNPLPIQRNKYIPEAEKLVLIAAQKLAAKRFSLEVLGNEKTVIDDTDKYLWEQAQYSKLLITNETTSMLYDTDNISHLLLYWQIITDAFWFVAYNEDHATFKTCPYFIQEIKDAEIRESHEELTKVEAIYQVGILKAKGDVEALLFLCWSLGDRKDKMLGFSRSTSMATLVAALFNFIDGKTKDKNKKSAITEWFKQFALYNANREAFMARVIVRIADFHNYIGTNKEKVYVTQNGIELGKTLDECVDKLTKVSNRDIFDEITTETMKYLTNDN